MARRTPTSATTTWLTWPGGIFAFTVVVTGWSVGLGLDHRRVLAVLAWLRGG